ncbi:hypothetical protein Zmor_025008 [Zophobas morio]|uniref:Uncharacterized protein n=1 Tax=Zophobas morio TaxID=2755281 RepID=A0AA38M449_9CUCU|nr:hypothetical protein Zmor_025008 [Zophobas morio]
MDVGKFVGLSVRLSVMHVLRFEKDMIPALITVLLLTQIALDLMEVIYAALDRRVSSTFSRVLWANSTVRRVVDEPHTVEYRFCRERTTFTVILVDEKIMIETLI